MADQTPITKRQRIQKRQQALWRERSTWEKRWQQISTHLLPFAGRFYSTDRNQGDKTFNNIIDSTATRALRILAAGMMSGMTSPARPWFRLATPDPELMEHESVEVWLAKVTRLMRDVFHKGNTYRSLHTLYEELGAFNTASAIIDPDFDFVIWNHPLTAGEYAIATDSRGKVNTLVRKYEMTVEQIVWEFVYQKKLNGGDDWDAVTQTVKNMWDTHNYDRGIEVVHLVEPRAMRERDLSTRYSRRLPRNMPFRSCYIESASNDDKLLRESGYRDFPGVCPRWHTRGGDVYGVGPGMEALGDIKQLQQEQFRKAQGIDYMARPPIAIPAEFKGREIDTLPGGVSYFNMGGNAKIQNLMDVRIDLSHLLEDIRDVRERINSHFFADLFLLISQDNRATPATATEIAERHEEKLLMLGPVLERLHDEMLSPLIDITFSRLLEAGALPPPPPELHGMDLKVEFVSVLAQAQRAVGLGAIDRLLGTVGNLAAASQDPSVWDKIAKDDAVERYADMLAVDPELIVSDEKVALVRQSRAEQQQQQAVMQAAPDLAKAYKDAAEGDQTAGGPSGTIEQFTGFTP